MINIKDFTTALRSLSRAKGYSATIVLTLGITLGALVTMFNLNYQLLASPLPYPEEDRLYISQGNVSRDGSENNNNRSPYPALITAYNNYSEYFERQALVTYSIDNILNLPDSPRVNTSYITPEYLQLLQTPLELGRAFNPDEGLDTNSPVAMLSHATWQEQFNRDPDVLGKTLRIGEVDFQIIGITAVDFVEPQLVGTGRLTQVWLPWDYNWTPMSLRNAWGILNGGQHLIGKLKTGVQSAQAEHALSSSLNARFKDETAAKSSFDPITIGIKLKSYRQAILGDSKGRALLLLAGVLALVLIAAVNITNLILARAANQHRSMAIQAALGAQKFHLFNAVFAEILLLMALAVMLALAVAFGGIELLELFAASQLPRVAELSLNWQSLVFALLSALALALLFALLVSKQINYRALHKLLQSSGKGAGIQISGKVRQLLILSQVALTGVLLAASIQILQQSLQHIAQPLGFASKDIYYVLLNMGAQQNAPAAEQRNNRAAIRNELLGHPKVDNVSLASGIPIHSGGDIQWHSYLNTDLDLSERELAATTLVDENYLDILRLELVVGRQFSAEEVQSEAKLIIINEALSHRLQAYGQVLNQRFYWGNNGEGLAPYKVIGIVRDLTLPGRAEEPRMYIPQADSGNPLLVLKHKPGQQFSGAELNKVMARIDSQYKVAELLSMTRAHKLLLARDALSAGVTAALALLALSLAAIGIYGVLSYSVLVRRFELGIRMAIGARPITVFLQLLKENLAPVILGLAVSLAALAGLWLWIQQGSYSLQTSTIGWLLPVLLILALTAATTLLSVWAIIRKPAISVLHNN